MRAARRRRPNQIRNHLHFSGKHKMRRGNPSPIKILGKSQSLILCNNDIDLRPTSALKGPE